jgi:hypothetical protein
LKFCSDIRFLFETSAAIACIQALEPRYSIDVHEFRNFLLSIWGRSLRQITIVKYIQTINSFFSFVGITGWFVTPLCDFPLIESYVNHLSQVRSLAPKTITCYISGLSRLLCFVRTHLSRLTNNGPILERMEMDTRLKENELKLQPLYRTLTKLNKPLVQKRTASYNNDILVSTVSFVQELLGDDAFFASMQGEMDRLSAAVGMADPTPLEMIANSEYHHFSPGHMRIQAYLFSFLCVANCWRVSSLARLHVFDILTVESVQGHKLVNCSDHKHGSSGQLVVPDKVYVLLMQLVTWRLGKTLIDRMKAQILIYLNSSCSRHDQFRRQFSTWLFVTRSGSVYTSGKGLELIRSTLKSIIAHRQNGTSARSALAKVTNELNTHPHLPDTELLKLCCESLTTRQVRAVSMNLANKTATNMAELNHLDQHLGHTANTRQAYYNASNLSQQTMSAYLLLKKARVTDVQSS